MDQWIAQYPQWVKQTNGTATTTEATDEATAETTD
jgi:hypothetical protein